MIAAITSCTNTSNPQVMVAAGLLAKRAVELGLRRAPWVKTSLAPGSRVVTDYYERAGLQTYLDQLGFNTVGYGCTTCIGNSGPLLREVSQAITDGDLVACAVLSGNRNFEARIHPEVKANYLASPPLVVAYALAGRIDLDLEHEPLAQTPDGRDVFLRDLWPTSAEIQETIASSVHGEMFTRPTPTSSPATTPGGASSRRPATSTPGTPPRPTSASRPTSTVSRPSRRRSRTSRARAASSRSATRSRPTTSRRPARSGSTRPPGAT